jgi:hypothetical protein
VNVTRGPTVTIRYHVGDDGRYVVQVNDTEIPTNYDEKQIGGLQKWLREAFEKFANELAVATKWQDAWDALSGLTTSAVTVVEELFGHDKSDGFRIEQVLKALYPGWRRAEQPALFNVVADLDQFLPLELLPLFDTTLLPEGGSRHALQQAVRCYPGFSTVVHRQFPNISPAANDAKALKLDNFEHLLPLRFFWNKELPGAVQESEFFDQLKGVAIERVEPWPGEVEPRKRDRLTGELAGWLRDGAG